MRLLKVVFVETDTINEERLMILHIATAPLHLVSRIIASCAVALSVLYLCGEANAAEPKPGQEMRIVFNIGGAQVPITFRYCPSGQIFPGEPKQDDKRSVAAAESELLGGPKRMSPFYLSETEVTVSQFAQVVGFDHFRRLTGKAAKMKGAKEEVSLLVDGNDKSPIFMVGPLDAIAFCKMLNELQTSGADIGKAEIERLNFRLPSHIEWQFACRAISDADGANKYPHFHSWADYDALDKNDRAKCLEEWKEMGRQESDFAGTQFQVAEIITKRYSTTNSKPLEILSVFLKQGIHSNRDFSKSTTAPLGSIKSTGPNSWGLYDMHDNVREWTIAIDDRGELQRLWRELVNQGQINDELRQRKLLFLAGGAANDTMAGGADAAWNAFAIWGGRPMDVKSGTPEYFSLADDETADKTFDYAPGLRILLERVLADDWLLVVRRKTVLSNDKLDEALASIDQFQQVIREIVAESSQNEKAALLAYYAGLAQYRMGKVADAASIIDSQKANLAPARKKKVDLSSLDVLGTNSASNAKPARVDAEPSEDAMYFGYLADLLKQDTRTNN